MKKKRWLDALFWKSFIQHIVPLFVGLVLMAMVATLSVRTINTFVQFKNHEISQAVAANLSTVFDRCVNEAEQIVLSYTTNQRFFPQLQSVLASSSITYTNLQTLRSLQKNIELTRSLQPYLNNLYFCVESDADIRFVISDNDGIYNASSYADGLFIREVYEKKKNPIEFRYMNDGTFRQTAVLSVSGWKTDNAGNVIGTAIVNMDCNALQSQLQAFLHEQTEEYYLITDETGQTLLHSPALHDSLSALNGKQAVFEKDGGTYALPVNAVVQDSNGFRCWLISKGESGYATGKRLITENLLIILISLLVGIAVVWIMSARKYKDYVLAGDFMKKIDEIGSNASNGSGYSSRYEDIQNSIQLALSEHELKERRLELETMRHQLNPHFLMNTLQTLNWRLIREQGKYTEMNVIIENLCKILSYSLRPVDALVSLTEEINYTKAYILLQFRNDRQPDAICWELGDKEETDTLLVPRMIFQPILENTFKHAFKGEMTGEMNLSIRRRTEAGDLYLTVSDNGCGMTDEVLMKVRNGIAGHPSDGHGIGLYNTNKRIQLLFGSRFGLSIESGSGGTNVCVHLPLVQKHEV